MRAIGNSTVLTNALNANFADWEKYAAEWNVVKENRAKVIIIRQFTQSMQLVCRTL